MVPFSMRSLAILLVTYTLVWSTSGYLQLDVEAYSSTCSELVGNSWCSSALLNETASDEALLQRRDRARQRFLGALWKCQGLQETNASSGTKLRVLVWDLYKPWMEPALARFSNLYGIPLDLDYQPYERSSASIGADPPEPKSKSQQPPPRQSPQQQQQPQQPPQRPPGGSSPPAVWLHSSADTQGLAQAGRLADFGELLEQEQYGLDWFDVGQSYRLQLVPYAGRTVAVPLDGTMLHLFYREDVLQALGLSQVPQTWTQLVEFTISYRALATSKGAAAAGSGAMPPPHPICVARDVGCRHESYLQAIWSSIAQTHGSAQAIHFDATTMRPLLDSAAGSAALRIMAQLLSAAAPLEPDEGCSHGSLAFARGRCALALAGFVPQLQMLSEARANGTALPGGAVVRVSELPGSEWVWDGSSADSSGGGGAAALTRCTPSNCPYGTRVAGSLAAGAAASGQTEQEGDEEEDQQQQQQQQQVAEVLVNRAPQAATSLLVGGIDSRAPLLVRLVGFELLSYLASPERYGVDELATPLRSAFPVRPELLRPSRLGVWRAAGYDSELVQDAMAALYGSMTHPNLAWGLRMPGQAAYIELIGEVIESILAGNVSVDPWVMEPTSATGNAPQSGRTPLAQVLALGSMKLTGRYPEQNSSGLYEASRHPWVLSPLTLGRCRAPLAASSSTPGSRSRSVLLPVLLATLLTLTAAAGLALLAWALLCRSRSAAAVMCGVGYARGGAGCLSVVRRGSRKVHVPVAGAQVALCVTDIQDSTSLWESLPADTLARAVDIHHRCVRRLALRHGGYESATEGDSFILAFSSVRAAVAFALELQTQLLNAPSWPQLLLEQEVCRPVYTRLPAGYPFSRAAALPPRAPRSSGGVAAAAVAAAAASPVAAAGPAAVAPTATPMGATAGFRLPEDPARVGGSGGSGGGAAADALYTTGEGAAVRHHHPPSPPPWSYAERFRSSTGGMMTMAKTMVAGMGTQRQQLPRPQLGSAGPRTAGATGAGSTAFPRGRSLGDLVHPPCPQLPQGPSASSPGAASATDTSAAGGGGGGGRSRLHFPEPVASSATPMPLGCYSDSGGVGAGATIPPAAAVSPYFRAGASVPWCQADACGLAGAASGGGVEEEAESALSPPRPSPARTVCVPLPIRSSNAQLQPRLSWPGGPPASSSSCSYRYCRPLGPASALCVGEVEAHQPAATPPESELEADRRHHHHTQLRHPLHQHQHLHHQQPHHFHHYHHYHHHHHHFQQQQQHHHHHHHQQQQQQQQQQQPSFARSSVPAQCPEPPNGDSELLPVWGDSGPLTAAAAAAFSVYSNTTYITSADGMALGGGAVSFATNNGRLWDDGGDGDFVSSASNALFSPTSAQQNALPAPSSISGMGGAPGPAAAAATAAAPGRGDARPSLGGSGGGGGCQTLLEALQAAAAAAASRTLSAGSDNRSLSQQREQDQEQLQAQHHSQAHAHVHHHHHHHHHLLHPSHEHLMFRGLRVRVGISVAVPTAAELQYNAAAARMVYGGPCVAACKALADLAHGGQVFLSARAHAALAAEYQGLGGKPPGTMVLQVALMESTSPPPPPPQPPPRPLGTAATADGQPPPSCTSAAIPAALPASLARDSSYLISAEALALQSWHNTAVELQIPLPRVPEHVSGGVGGGGGGVLEQHLQQLQQLQDEQQQASLQQYLPQAPQAHHRQQQQPGAHVGNLVAHVRDLHLGLGWEPVYLVTSPPLSQRLALLPPPRFSPERPPLQDVYRAPLGRVSYAVVRVPAASALLRWDGRVAAEALKVFVRTAVSELRRVPGAYLVSSTPAEIQAAFPSAVLAVAWALHLRTALLRAPWPPELLQHELGEAVEAFDGGGGAAAADVSGPPSESCAARLRWTSAAAGLSRVNGSREGSVRHSTGGGGGAGGRGGSAWAHRPGGKEVTHGTAAASRAQLLRVGSIESDGGEPSAGSLEPLARTGASPPLRRHRHSVDCLFPAPAPPAAAANAARPAASAASVGKPKPESDVLTATGTDSGRGLMGEGGFSGALSYLDHQTRALALLADHLLRNHTAAAADADAATEDCEGGGHNREGSGAGGGSADVGYLASTPSAPLGPLRLPAGASQPPAQLRGLRRATADGIAPPAPQRQEAPQQPALPHPLLQQQQQPRMAVPVPVPSRQSWHPHHHPHHHQQQQQRQEGTEDDAAAAAAATANDPIAAGTSFRAECQFSFHSAGPEAQAPGSYNAAEVADEAELGLGLGLGVLGGAFDSGRASPAAASASLLHVFPSGGGGEDDPAGGEELCSEPHSALPDRNNAPLSRMKTWASSYLWYGEASGGGGATAQASGSGISDISGRAPGAPAATAAAAAAAAAAQAGEVDLASVQGAGPASFDGVSGAAASGSLAAAAAAVAARSAPLFAVPWSGPLLMSRRSHHEAPAATTNAATAADAVSAAAAAAATLCQPQPGSGRRGRLLLRGLRIHVGVATGALDWAISGRKHALVYTGRAVGRARRLSEAASSGKVMCDRGTHRDVLRVQQAIMTTKQPVAAAAAAAAASGADPDDGGGSGSGGGGGGGSGGGGGGGGIDGVYTERVALELQLVRVFAGARLSVRAVDEAYLCELRPQHHRPTPLPPPPLLVPALGRATVPSSPAAHLHSPAASALAASAHTSAPSNVLQPQRGATPPAAPAPSAAAVSPMGRRQPPAPTHNSGPLLTASTSHTPHTRPTMPNPRPTAAPLRAMDGDLRGSGGGGGGAMRPGPSPRSPVQLQFSPEPADSGCGGEQQQRVARQAAWRRGSGGGSSPGLLALRGPEISSAGRGPAPLQHLRPQHSLGGAAEAAGAAAAAAAAARSSDSGMGCGTTHAAQEWGRLSLSSALQQPTDAHQSLGRQSPYRVSPASGSSFLGRASDCGLSPACVPAAAAFSGLLSTATTTTTSAASSLLLQQQQPSSMALRLSPAQRFRSVTADGHMPYIICERVDEEGEGCSEDASGQAAAASTAAAAAALAGDISCSSGTGAGAGAGAGAGSASAGEAAADGYFGGVEDTGDEGATMSAAPPRDPETAFCSNGGANAVGRPDAAADPASLDRREYGGDASAPVWGKRDPAAAAAAAAAAAVQAIPRGLEPLHACRIVSPRALGALGALAQGAPVTTAVVVEGVLPPALLTQLDGGGGAVAVPAIQVTPEGLPPPLARAWRRTHSHGRPEAPRLALAGARGLAAAAGGVGEGSGGGGSRGAWKRGWSFAERESSCVGAEGMQQDERNRAGGWGQQQPEVEGEFEFMFNNSRSCSITGGLTATEVTVRSLLQGRLLAQMAAAAGAALKPDSAAAAAAAATAHSPMSPTLLLTIGSSGRRGSANISGGSYLCNSGSGGVNPFNPPTFAGLAQLPPGGPSEASASSTGSSFRLVPTPTGAGQQTQCSSNAGLSWTGGGQCRDMGAADPLLL